MVLSSSDKDLTACVKVRFLALGWDLEFPNWLLWKIPKDSFLGQSPGARPGWHWGPLHLLTGDPTAATGGRSRTDKKWREDPAKGRATGKGEVGCLHTLLTQEELGASRICLAPGTAILSVWVYSSPL